MSRPSSRAIFIYFRATNCLVGASGAVALKVAQVPSTVFLVTYEEKEHEQAQFPHGSFQGSAQDLETLGVAGQLEDSKYSNKTYYSQDSWRTKIIKFHRRSNIIVVDFIK